MIPDLSEKTITRAESRYSLKMWTSDGWRLLLAGDTTLTYEGGAPVDLDTEIAQDEPIVEVLPLIGRTITRIAASREGNLSIRLGDAQLDVRAGEDHEAWQINGPDGEMIICLPGGEFAGWDARPM